MVLKHFVLRLEESCVRSSFLCRNLSECYENTVLVRNVRLEEYIRLKFQLLEKNMERSVGKVFCGGRL